MSWLEKLDKKNGSRPRCVLLMEGKEEEVASRLTDIVGFPNDVVITCEDIWRPMGKTDVREAQLDASTSLLLCKHRKALKVWWLNKGSSHQKWDIASTCTFNSRSGHRKRGLLLVEAKAHSSEFSGRSDRTGATGKNRKRIGEAIAEASAGLESVTGNRWNLSRDRYYQLSNRFAWSWKVASLGIPVVLLYLGFLEAKDMAGSKGSVFHSESDWECLLRRHCEGIIDNTCWGKCLDVNGVPLLPLIRAREQPFQPCER